jgi:hypothetical protein
MAQIQPPNAMKNTSDKLMTVSIDGFDGRMYSPMTISAMKGDRGTHIQNQPFQGHDS